MTDMKRIYFFILLSLLVLLGGCATTGVNSVAGSKVDLLELRDQAIKYYRQGQYEQALKSYNILVKSVPEDADLWFKKANTHARLLQPTLAIEAYQKAVTRNPKHYKAWRNMSTIHLRQAMNSLTQLMAVLPPDDPLYDSTLLITEETMNLLNVKPESYRFRLAPSSSDKSNNNSKP